MITAYSDSGSDRHKELVSATLESIYVLLEGNDITKQQFKDEIGYSQLYDILLVIEPEITSTIIMNKILQLMLETTDDKYTNLVIKSPAVLMVYIKLLPHCSAENQLYYLNILHLLLSSEKSTLNLSLTGSNLEPPLLDLLLDILSKIDESVMELFILVITIVASHGLTIRQLKRIFSLMKNTGNERPYCAMKFLTVLQNILRNNVKGVVYGSSRYFLFDGINSGMILNSNYLVNNVLTMRKELPVFPYTGYTLSIWYNCVSLQCPWLQDSSNRCLTGCTYIPYLFTIRDKAGNGIECYIKDSEIMVDMYERKMCVSNQPTGIRTNCNVWEHIVITHSNGGFMKQPGLNIYINGTLKYKSPMACVVLTEPFVAFATGGPYERGILQTDHTSFNGKLGPIYLLNKVISDEQVSSLYQLGPDYMFTFQSSQLDHRQLHCVPPACLFDGSLTNSIVFTFNAFTYKDDLLLNNAPNENFNQMFGSGRNYKLLEGIYCQLLTGSRCCYTRTVLDILDSLNGITVFLPIFAEADLKNGKTKDYTPELNFIPTLINIFYYCLYNNKSNTESLISNNGVQVISYLLNSISPVHKSTELITTFYDILTSDKISTEIRDQIYYYIILNIKLWLFSPFAVHQRIFDILTELSESNIEKFIDICNIPYLLDIMQRYYYYELDVPNEEHLTIYRVYLIYYLIIII